MDELKDKIQSYAPKNATNKALNDVLSDGALLEELRKSGITERTIERELPLVSSYQDDRAYCLHCPGLDQCQKEPNPQMAMKLVFVDGLLQREYSPCELSLEKNRLLNGYLYRDFPEAWLSNTLKGLPRTTRVKVVMSAFANALKDPLKNWVYLTGDMGSGRSYLLATFCNNLVDGGSKVAFINANKRFDELKGLAISARALFEKRMGELENCDLLVIDDFGSEYKSDYVRDQIVMPLLAERAKNARRTFFASDFSLEEIQSLYSTDKTSAIYAKQLVGFISSRISAPIKVEKGFETYLKK